jgi:dihydropyrimidinase
VLIKGGRIVTASDDYVADVFIDGERVTLIGESLDQLDADRVIDARGKYLFPGCVDPHTHLDMAFGGRVTIDDVESEIAPPSAARPPRRLLHQAKGQTFADALADWHAKAEGKRATWATTSRSPISPTTARSTSSPRCASRASPPYKLFMAYKGALMVDDETLFRAMEVAARSGALVMVHAENGGAIDVLVSRRSPPATPARSGTPDAAARGRARRRTARSSWRRSPARRSTSCTCRARRRSSRRLARAKGWKVWGETCASTLRRHHALERPNFEGGKYVHAAAAARQPGRPLGRGAHGRARPSRRTTARSSGKDRRRWARTTSKIPNGGPGLEERCG